MGIMPRRKLVKLARLMSECYSRTEAVERECVLYLLGGATFTTSL